MIKEKNTSEEKVEVKPKGKQTPTKDRKSKKQTEAVHLPVLLELIYFLSTIILILLALVIMGTSFLAGASLFTIVLRTAVAVTVVGALLMLIASQISSGLLFSVKVDQEEEQKKQEEAAAMSSEELNKAEA
jgi:hypothetical protein